MANECCITLNYENLTSSGSIQLTNSLNELNGQFIYEAVIDTITHYLWYDGSFTWYFTQSIPGDTSITIASLPFFYAECPYSIEKPGGDNNDNGWILSEGYSIFNTEPCETPCCLDVSFQPAGYTNPLEFTLDTPDGYYNGSPFYRINVGNFCWNLFKEWNGDKCVWRLDSTKCGSSIINTTLTDATLRTCGECPIGNFDINDPDDVILLAIVECGGCISLQDRTFREYDSIKLPEVFEEDERGYMRCCCDFNVLASPSNDSWKSDITSAWIKLSDPSDIVNFVLKKDGVITNYIPSPQAFVNEENAFYVTIPWIDVLNADGAGCYTLEIEYNISGVIASFTWGVYNLKPYSIQNALKTARLRVKFNSFQEIENIDFTGSNVEDTIRFYGYIGNREPNMEIDNIIYENREMRKVIRENLNKYEILTDPTCEQITKQLTDLYLLSENQLFISDYNAHNHSYRYNDLPVIVEESPEIEYYDFSREASVKCIVSDKFKNKRSYYNG